MDGIGCWRHKSATYDDYCSDTGSTGLREVSKSTAWVKYKVIFTFNRRDPQAKTKVPLSIFFSVLLWTWTGIRIFRVSPFYMFLSCSWNLRKVCSAECLTKTRFLPSSLRFSRIFFLIYHFSSPDTFLHFFLSFSESIFICRKSMNFHRLFGFCWVDWPLGTSH